MSTPRVGALGVATTKGDLYVVNDLEELERVPVGTDDQVLVADSTTPLGVAWKDPAFLNNVSFQCDAVDAIFKKIDLGGGAINNAQAKTRGTHAVLAFDAATVEGNPWQKFMPAGYSAGSVIRVSIYWVADTAVVGDVVWAAAFERNEAGNNITTDNFAALQTAAASTAPGVAGVEQVATIDFTQVQADSVAAGDPLRLFVQRTAGAVGDTMVGDAQIVRVVVEELQP
jgi:hypothetical protein